ncbi:MAG: transcription-repair coupling factor [bacterium]
MDLIQLVTQSVEYKKQLGLLDCGQKASFAGMVGSSSALLLAALLENYKQILIITSSTEKAEALRSEMELFSGQKTKLFPAPDTLPGEEIQPSKELIGERLAVIKRWQDRAPQVVAAPIKAVMWMTSLRLEDIRLSGDTVIRIDKLIEDLISLGYKRFDIVGEKGEFSVRGGIIDIFPLNLDNPVRIEFIDDKIDSIRSFDAYSQRSIGQLIQLDILPAFEAYEEPVFKYLPKETLVVFAEAMDIERLADREVEELTSALRDGKQKYINYEEIKRLCAVFKNLELSCFIQPQQETFVSAAPAYLGRLPEIPGEAVVFSKHAARLQDELKATVIEGSLRGGFVIDGQEILSDKELFGEEVVLRRKKALPKEGVADELLADLKLGDYVVHETYGIGRFAGMTTLDLEGINQEYMLIEFAGDDKVYVPPSYAGLVEKYSSGSDFKPKLSRLGTKTWLKTKANVKNRLKSMTKELLSLYAARQKLPGIAFPVNDVWQKELENTFPYVETPDQRQAIKETKLDMEQARPMDRLVCGDVGYGKTEVAIRAAAKAVAAGKQVAILVPTTILAEQHYNNFRERFHSSPFVIEMLSRFRSKKDQAATVKALAQGGVDIVIGTHRLLQKDIKFKDPGLLIIDEEQRFGVSHKEKLKNLAKNIDVLTLSATPIPRTLYLSLSGARDMSTINTPPVDRSPIRTYVLPWSEAVIREAILRELDRGGQIYFLHNFVETIEGMAAKIKRLVPEAKVAVAHGQMPEKTLETTMLDFMERKFNVLVCTSIIESGLDISSVNTILIDQADRFGLSQLYQIRGRVGRSPVRAYAYLFYHSDNVMTDGAIERLKAIQEFTALGSGYKLAMRDLEIRGAGNLLGAQQSGHVMEVGFDLYCELLEEAVRELKGIKQATPREVEIDLKLEAYIPEEYIPDERQRIAVYRRLNLLGAKKELQEMEQELRDRFGPIPAKLDKLFAVLSLKLKALQANIKSIKEEAGAIIIINMSGKRKRVEIKGQDKLKLLSEQLNTLG